MIETQASSGKYQIYESNEWPSDGYVLNTELSKRDIKDIFSLTEVEFDILIEETNALNEMRCNGGKYSFHVENAAEDIDLKDFVKPIFFSQELWKKVLRV